MIFNTKVSGIPCKCQVTLYSAFKPMQVYGSEMGDCDPPDPSEFEFKLLDHSGYPADWLEKKLTLADEARLFEEFQLEHLGERYGYL